LFLIFTLGGLSLLLALGLTPLVRDSIGRLGFLDHPDGNRKKHASAVPRVGGIAIVGAYVGTFALALVLPFTYGYVLHNALPSIWKLALAASVVFLTGVIDDLVGLKAGQKMIGIGGAAVLAYFANIRVDIHFLHSLSGWHWLSFVLTVVWLIGCTNAFNLIDGMDGLATGVGLFATLAMLIAALTQHNLPLALATMPLAGCLLGFLPYNFNKASVFLGDSGSLLIGFLLGCYGALWSEKSVTVVAVTVPLLIVSIPLLEVVLSILRRFLRDRPIFQGDRGHIHHKLLERGFSPKGAVLVIYGLCGLAAMLALLANALHNEFSGLIVIAFCAAAWVGINHLGYAEFSKAGEMFLGGKFRRIIDAETRLLDFETALAEAPDVLACWSKILEGSREFGFQGVRMNMDGALYEDFGSKAHRPVWQLRIPLAGTQYINFFRDFDSDVNLLILNAFASSVERGLKAWAAHREAVVTRMPAASELAYAASAASGSKIQTS
jgi:UDP-GlcNAc:undecaprenyl-phosphate GlcNAc-1-phosphate transferase